MKPRGAKGLMTPERQEVLDRIMLPRRPGSARTKAEDASSAPQWEDLQYVVEGLIFAPRPVKAAMERVTKRYGLGSHGAHILNMINQGIVHPAELATVLRVSRSLITKELARLVEAKLVAGSQDDIDKRRSSLALTAEGSKVCDEVRLSMNDILQRNLRHYTRDQVRLFADMLRDVRALGEGEKEF